MKKWIKSFFAVDNKVNEQTVVGVFWGGVASILVVLYVMDVGKADLELVLTVLGAQLLCFGISGFKRI